MAATDVFSIYIKNYNMNGVYQSTETLLYSIPMDPDEPNALVDPKVVCEMGKAGSLDFNMNFGHPYYNALIQMKTLFRIEYDGETIFRGRVLTVGSGHMTGAKTVHCESDYAFFLDSQMEGKDDKERPKTNVLTYLQTLITNHNARVSEDGTTDKTFVLGEVPGQYSNAITNAQKVQTDNSYQYGSTGWKDTQSELSNLANSYGGCFRTRYQNGTVYLDWLDGYYNSSVNLQTIELGENLLDITSNSQVNNIFTALIPIGSSSGKKITIKGYQIAIHGDNDHILVPQIAQVFSDAELNKGYHTKQGYLNAVNEHGIIYKTQSFPNADTQQKLWEYATDWIKNNYVGDIHEFEVSAVDMHVLGESSGKFLVGDRVSVIYPDISQRATNPNAMITSTLTMTRIEYDLYHPEKNTYQIGIPNMLINREYGIKKSSSGGGGAMSMQDQVNYGVDGFLSKLDQYNYMYVIDAATYHPGKFKEYVDTLPPEIKDKFDEAGQQTAFMYLNRYDDLDVSGKLHESTSMFFDGTSGIVNFNHAPIIARYGPEAGNIVRELSAASLMLKNGDLELDLKETWDEALDAIPKPGTVPLKTIFKLKTMRDGGTLTLNKIVGKDSTSYGSEISTMMASAKDDLLAVVKESIGSLDPTGDVKQIFEDAKGIFNFDGALDGLDFSVFNGYTDVIDADALTGLMKVGREDLGDDDPSNAWNVFINKTQSYPDSHGQTQTKTGCVTAADFGIDEVTPSMATKLAVIDDLFATKASIGDLEATTAKIDKITGNSIVAGSVCRAANMGFTTCYGGNIYCDHYYIQTSGTSALADCGSAFNDASITFDDGVFTMRLNRVHGGYKDVDFDVASSPWFAGEVEAVWDEAVGKISLPTGTSDSVTLTTPKAGAYGDDPDTETQTLELAVDNGYVKLRDHDDTSQVYAQIQAGSGASRSVSTLSATGVSSYEAGSNLATLSVRTTYTSGSNTNDSIRFVIQPGTYTPANSGAGTYNIEVAGDASRINFTATYAYNDGYGKGQSNGWDTACGKVTFPTGTAENVVLVTPKSGAFGESEDTNTLTLTLAEADGYIKLQKLNDASQVYARKASTAYEQGWAACYNTIRLNPSSSKTIPPAGSQQVIAQAKSTPTATSYTNVKVITVSAESGFANNDTIRRRAVSSASETYADNYLYRKTTRTDSSGKPIYASQFSVSGVGVYTCSNAICNVGSTKTVYYS